MTELEKLRAAELEAFRAYMSRLDVDPLERSRKTWEAREQYLAASWRVTLALQELG